MGLIYSSLGWIFSAFNFTVGLVYPVWSSMSALSSTDPTDDTQWLTYWLCYAVLLIFEYTLAWLIEWIPIYVFMKFILLVWMAIPYLRGAEYVYETILKPQFQNFKAFLGSAPALEFVKPPKEEKKADEGGNEGGNDTSAVKDQ